jgi:environmental stress-induced protein Ves
MRIVRESEQKRMPWKNGSGETIEIAYGPSGSTLENFDWRISRARVERSGPFSFFPGIDRTLAVLDGDNLQLRIDDAPPAILSSGSPPLSFAGEARVESQVEHPILDLNVMTRRGRFVHRLTALAPGQPASLQAANGVVSAIFTTGMAEIHSTRGKDTLRDNDAAFPSAEDGRVEVRPDMHTRLYLIEIMPSSS